MIRFLLVFVWLTYFLDIFDSNLTILRCRMTHIQLMEAGTITPCTPNYPIAGSVYWISPEMILGESVGTEHDIWSFGVFLLELLDSCPKNAVSCMYNTLRYGNPLSVTSHFSLQNASQSLNAMLARIFQKDPHCRYTAQQLLQNSFLEMAADETSMRATCTSIFVAKELDGLL